MTILVSVQSVATPWLDRVALAATQLGSEFSYVALLLTVYLAVDARAGRTLGLALLGGYYLNEHAKAAFATVRPYVLHPELLRGGSAAAETATGPAFPSGHAQGAATFWGLAALLGRRRWLTGVAATLIVVIGATRIYLGVHWPIDVIGGTAIGLGVAGLAWAVSRRRRALAPFGAALVWVVLPIALHLLAPTPDSGRLAGAFVGVATAPWLYRHEPSGSPFARAALAALGVALAVGWLVGTDVLLPETLLDGALVRPIRYLVLVWAGIVLAPAAVARIGSRRRSDGPA